METLKTEKMKIEATVDNLHEVLAFVDERLEAAECSMKAQMQLDLCVEELFVNIAHYAYTPNKGMAEISMEIDGDRMASVTFEDSGVPYDPLAKVDPDITLSADERPIGGLGIFMVKKNVDDIFYEHKDGKNILTIKKKI
ncbi:MAG: ATP-binding protein [Lachnospiraceae bacterium]|nr:ATP-binding protein [Lachnospiraceae bacterium]